MRGRPLKPAGQAITRHRPTHNWTEFPDIPNTDGPSLPPRRRNGRRWPGYAVQTWRGWAQMPHTVNWTAADWSYAADSLEVAVRASREDAGVSWWSELRHRQQEMGVTWSSRQSARIRYIPPAVDDDSDASISTLDDYRNL